jgi:hypothetical protein
MLTAEQDVRQQKSSVISDKVQRMKSEEISKSDMFDQLSVLLRADGQTSQNDEIKQEPA